MPAPTVFRSSDFGAPQYVTPNSGNDYYHQYFHDVLQACLVDGFNGRPGLGWTLIGRDNTVNSRKIAFRNATGTGCFRFEPRSGSVGYFVSRLYSEMTSLTSGANEQASGNAQQIQPLLSWCLVGDGKTFHFVGKCQSGSYALDAYQAANPAFIFFSVGEYDPCAPVVMAPGQLGNFIGVPLGGPSYPFCCNSDSGGYGAMPINAAGVANTAGVKATYPRTIGVPDFGEITLYRWPLASTVAPPVSVGGGTQQRLFGHARGLYCSTTNDHYHWKAEVDAGTYSIGSTKTIGGKDFILGLCSGYESPYISLDAADWS